MKKLTANLALLAFIPLLVSCFSGESGEDAEQKAETELEQLSTIGYLSGYREPKGPSGARLFKPDNVSAGYVLYSSGHSPAAFLIDRTGQVRHSWQASFEKIFPGRPLPKRQRKNISAYWRHVTLLPNGELLAIFEGLGLVKLARDSHVVWARLNQAHHDLQMLPDGGIALLTRQAVRRNGVPMLLDYVSFLDQSGEERRRVSILDAILDSPLKDEILRDARLRGDILHTNSLQLINSAAAPPGVSRGDILLSLREPDALVILNPHLGRVIWTFRGVFKQQHYARIVQDSGLLLLFDNFGARTFSRVLTYRWPTMEPLKAIGRLEGGGHFYTRTLGLAQSLPNANFLIVESEGGRIIEISSEGQNVWQYTNPHRTGPAASLVAAVPHAELIDNEAIDQWLSAAAHRRAGVEKQ